LAKLSKANELNTKASPQPRPSSLPTLFGMLCMNLKST